MTSPTTAPTPHALSTNPPPALAAGLLLVILVVAFESSAMGTVMPRLAGDLKGLSLYGWASSAFMLASLLGAILTGLLTDRRGVAWGAAFSLALFGVGLLVVGGAPTMPLVIAGRFIEGVGVGGLNALPFVVITAAYRDEAKARMLAAVSSMWLVPGLVGPVLASFITAQFSWRAVPWCLAGLLVLAAPLCLHPLRRVPRLNTAATQKRILWPTLGLMVAFTALIEGLRRTDALGLPLALAGLVGLVWTARPLFPRGMWRMQPGLPSALVLRGFVAFALMGQGSFVTLALREVHKLPLAIVGISISIGGLSWTIGAWTQAYLEKRYGPPSRLARIRYGLMVLTCGMTLTSLGMIKVLPYPVIFAGGLIAGIGMGIAYNSNSLYAMNSVPEGQARQLSSQLANIEVLMVALSAGISGALVTRIQPLEHALVYVVGMNILASLIPWVAARRLTGR